MVSYFPAGTVTFSLLMLNVPLITWFETLVLTSHDLVASCSAGRKRIGCSGLRPFTLNRWTPSFVTATVSVAETLFPADVSSLNPFAEPTFSVPATLTLIGPPWTLYTHSEPVLSG